MQMGVDYVKKMSEILKSQINLLRATYEPIASEGYKTKNLLLLASILQTCAY